MNKEKVIQQLESIIYNNTRKEDADKILSNYIKLLNYMDLPDYRISVSKRPLGLKIKHKAFDIKLFLRYKKGKFLLEEKQIDPKEINTIIPYAFSLDFF